MKLTTHPLAGTYSVLTRLPGDAATLLAANFEDSIAPIVEVAGDLPAVLAPPLA